MQAVLNVLDQRGHACDRQHSIGILAEPGLAVPRHESKIARGERRTLLSNAKCVRVARGLRACTAKGWCSLVGAHSLGVEEVLLCLGLEIGCQTLL